jgi:signal transduction histidine kinase
MSCGMWGRVCLCDGGDVGVGLAVRNIAAGEHYSDLLTPIWNTGIRLSVFLLVVILFSNRDHLKKLVEQRTEKLRQEIRERSRLEKELLEIAEAEQRRIGHDLHDSLGQHLTATALAGKVLAKKLANKSVVEPAMADRVVAMVEEAIELTRNLARTLHPIELGADGLVDALQNLAANLSKAFNVSCRFQHSGAVVLATPRRGHPFVSHRPGGGEQCHPSWPRPQHCHLAGRHQQKHHAVGDG